MVDLCELVLEFFKACRPEYLIKTLWTSSTLYRLTNVKCGENLFYTANAEKSALFGMIYFNHLLVS